jgi:hypothetical protein
MEEELAAGRRMPFGGGVTVDRKRFTDLIAELRLAVPANVKQARGILERGEQAIAESREQAARIVAAAEREASDRVAESEIVRRANDNATRVEASARELADRTLRSAGERATQMVAEAELAARQQREDADRYAVALLTQLQRTLGAFLGNVRESLREFPELVEEPPSPPRRAPPPP